MGFVMLLRFYVRAVLVMGIVFFCLKSVQVSAEPTGQLSVKNLDSLKNDPDKIRQRLIDNSKPNLLTKKFAPQNFTDLQMVTVDNIVNTRQKYSKLEATYRGLEFFRKVGEWTDTDFLEMESEDLAKELCLYHAITITADYIKHSPLEKTYRTIVEDIRRFSDNSTIGLSQHSGGELKLHHGANSTQDSLLQLRLRASVHNGLETQLKIGNNVRLRYGLLDSQTSLEYVTNF